MNVKSFILLIILMTLNGCASIFFSNQQEVKLISEVDGVDVYVDGEFIGATPITTKLLTTIEHNIFYKKGQFSYEKVIHANDRPTGLLQFFCLIDFFPGFLLVMVPPIIDDFSHVCYRFKNSYVLPLNLRDKLSIIKDPNEMSTLK